MGVLRVQTSERHPSAGNKIRVLFSEAINIADAIAGNFAIDNGITVSAVNNVSVPGSAQNLFDLTVTGSLTKNTVYTLTVINVRDNAGGTPIVSPNNALRFIWLGIGDINLNGVPEAGGLLARVSRNLLGNFALGYNILIEADTLPPGVTLVSPTNGVLDRFTEVVIDITDVSGFALINLSIELPTGQEVIYRGGAFCTGYVDTSARSGIVNGYRLTFSRKAGWPPGTVLKLNVDPVDTKGNTI